MEPFVPRDAAEDFYPRWRASTASLSIRAWFSLPTLLKITPATCTSGSNSGKTLNQCRNAARLALGVNDQDHRGSRVIFATSPVLPSS